MLFSQMMGKGESEIGREDGREERVAREEGRGCLGEYVRVVGRLSYFHRRNA